jgi:hypothetical protein
MARPTRCWQSWLALTLVSLGTLAVAAPVGAGELGHYAPGLLNVRDTIMPGKGLYAAVYGYYFTSSDFRNANGDKVRSVTGPAGRTVTLDVDVDAYAIVPALLWNTGFKILGAEYGLFGVVPLGGPSVQVQLASQTGAGVTADESTFGLQDIFIQPLWLGWRTPHVDVTAGYGFAAPTGRFEQGASDNLGLGYWTHQFQVAGALYFLQKATAVVVAATHEINQEKEGVDITPGQRFSLNYGVSQFLPAGPGLLELGVLGYSQWQVTDDSGSGVTGDRSVHDQLHAVGAQLGYAVPSWRLAVVGKYVYQYYAEDRFRGHEFTLTVGYQFF